MEPISINTKGHCFLCLDEGEGFGTQSLQSLCRYSKIDVGNILTSLTFGLASSSNVNVSLCVKCNKVVSQISSKHQLLETLQIELENLVGTVHESIQMAEADENLIQKEEFLEKMNADLGCRLQLKFVNELRMTLSNKCNQMGPTIPTIQPRVEIMELMPISKTEDEDSVPVLIEDHKVYTEALVSSGTDATDSSASPQSQDIEETIQSGEISMERRSGRTRSSNNLSSIGIDTSDLFVRHQFQTNNETFQSAESLFKKKKGRRPPGLNDNSLNDTLKANSILNPGTGIIQCTKCLKEFRNAGRGFRLHFESKHLGIQHKCNFCEKSFPQKASLGNHIKSCRKKTGKKNKVERQEKCLPLNSEIMEFETSTPALDVSGKFTGEI